MTTPFASRLLGSTALPVGPLGLGSSFGLPGKEVERAFDRGVRFFLWGSLRRADFAVGLRNIAQRNREDAVIAIQSYARFGWTMPFGVDRALRAMKTDYVDFLCLAWWNGAPPPRIVDAALRLRESGKVRRLMISSHHRPLFAQLGTDAPYDAFMLRYNAAHPGAEREIFPQLPERRPGTIAFTATRWGSLLDPRLTPPGEAVPRPSDCYRFALTNPNVDVCLAGPKDAAQLDEALSAIDRGPMSDDELAWMRCVGAHVRDATKASGRGVGMAIADRISRAFSCTSPPPKQLSAG